MILPLTAYASAAHTHTRTHFSIRMPAVCHRFMRQTGPGFISSSSFVRGAGSFLDTHEHRTQFEMVNYCFVFCCREPNARVSIYVCIDEYKLYYTSAHLTT